MSRLTLKTPADYVFRRDVCSYGYFLLKPNVWSPKHETLVRPLNLDGGMAILAISQAGGKRGADVVLKANRKLSKAESSDAKRQVRRMLSLDDDGVRSFHKVDPRFRKSGRGRLFRSPTLFEDIIKTVTSCNVAWTSTIRMNERLCETINPAFPTDRQMARRKPATLRARCSVGYRDRRMVDLAKLSVKGEIDEAWYEDPRTSDEDAHEALLGLPGIGPYAAANVMQLLGRYSHIPCDTETVRHAKTVLGMSGTDRQITNKVHEHYEPFGEHKFRSYWFELWEFYEAKRGRAWTWEPETTGKTFTAAQLKEGA